MPKKQKPETCRLCAHNQRTLTGGGGYCTKNKEQVTDNDWCAAFRRKQGGKA